MKTAVQELIKEFQDLKKTLLYPSTFKAVDECIDLCYAKLEMEKQQMIDAGNSCAIKQHLHNDMIDKMSNAEAMVFTQTDNLNFGEQYYNETFNK